MPSDPRAKESGTKVGALRKSEEHYRAIFEQVAVGIVHTSLQGKFRLVNQAFCAMSGYSRTEARRLHIRDITHAEDIGPSVEGRDNLLACSEPSHQRALRLLRRDGAYMWVDVTTSLVRGADGTPLHFVLVLSDVSERKRAEEEVSRFRAAMDVAVESIFLTDPATMRFLYVNDTACRRLGYTREQLLKKAPFELIDKSPEELRREDDEVVAAGESGTRTETRYVRSDGGTGWTELYRRALSFGSGTVIVTIARDVTERRTQQEKQLRGRQVFFTPDPTKRTGARPPLEAQLMGALNREEFVLHYEPQVDTAQRRVVGLEALIRWQNRELGLVSPAKFIPLLEETGMILDVGAWALQRAAMDHRRWAAQGLSPLRVAVNVSAIQLRQRGFVQAVETAIRHDVSPTGINLEITETLVMEDVEANIRKLNEIRALGLQIAIDDFGTGYSSLSYLTKLPVQALKIDRSFIVAMMKDAAVMTLVQTIISLAHSLGIKVIAEGVEEEQQAKYLQLLRCDQFQGYLIGRPVPFDEMTHLLQASEVGKKGGP